MNEVRAAERTPSRDRGELVSRFMGDRHDRRYVKAVLDRFPALRKRNFFVLHNHNATSEHFDLRLQLDDELISWAIPRKFLGDGQIRLAAETVPHYFSEGIAEGDQSGRSYDALWDVGTYEIDMTEVRGDLIASETPESSICESLVPEDVDQEDKLRIAFHRCHWLDHGERFQGLRLTFTRHILDGKDVKCVG